MRISEIAVVAGLDAKDVIAVVEEQRERFSSKGFKLGKKLTAASSLDKELAAEVVGLIDTRRSDATPSAPAQSKPAPAPPKPAEPRRAEEARARTSDDSQRRPPVPSRPREDQPRPAAPSAPGPGRPAAPSAPIHRPSAPLAGAVMPPPPMGGRVPPPPIPQGPNPPAPAAPSAPSAISSPAAPPPPAPTPSPVAESAPAASAAPEAPAPPPAPAPAPAPAPVASAPAAPSAPMATVLSPAADLPPSPAPTAQPAPPTAGGAGPASAQPGLPGAPAAPTAGAPGSAPTHQRPRPTPGVGGPNAPMGRRDDRGPGGGMGDRRPPSDRPGGGYGDRRGPGGPGTGERRGPGGPGGPSSYGDRRGPGGPGTGDRRPPGDRPSGGYGDRRGPGGPGTGTGERRGPGGPGGPGGYGDRRGPGGPGGPGGYGDRRGPGDRGPRPAGPGGPGGGPGGRTGPGPGGRMGDRGPRPGGPGGPGRGPGDRGPRPGGGPGRPGGPAPSGFRDIDSALGEALPTTDEARNRRGADRKKETAIKDFLSKGLGSGLADDSSDRRAKRGPTPAAPAAKRRTDTDKRIRPTQIFGMEDDFRRGGKRPGSRRSGDSSQDRDGEAQQGPKVIELHGDFTVAQFAEKCGIEASEVIKKLFLMGELITINQILNPDLAELIAPDLGVSIHINREGDDYDVESFQAPPDAAEALRPRAPVVTVMGHVDHGKTSLLDRIRSAKVAEGEAGGITQHIGAYNVSTPKGQIVFLDTPGHEAFTSMRARGALVTDLVVLVVAANDGVQPQTVEAVNHAKAAKVPILVAINKIDVPGANPMRVKQDLMKHGLVSEDLGGDTIMVHISAKRGDNIPELLELIALQTEVLELKANPERAAEGTIIESRIDPLRGATATVLVQTGTLRIGDIFLCGTEWGRIRAMRDDKGASLKEAPPSTPVAILGLTGSPAAGEKFLVLPDEATARSIAERRKERRKARSAVAKQQITLDNLAQHLASGESPTFNMILKADVQGSLEAIAAALQKIKSDKVQVRLLHNAVGGISESDVQLAQASGAVILGFNVRPDTSASKAAEEAGVEVRTYDIIYNMLEDVEKAMAGKLAPTIEEKQEGRARVLQIFKISKLGTIAGCLVETGAIGRDHRARLIRGGAVIWSGKVASLKRVKEDAKSVAAGLECGMTLEGYNDIKEGDYIETYTTKEVAATLN